MRGESGCQSSAQTTPSRSFELSRSRQQKADCAPAIVHLWFHPIISNLQTRIVTNEMDQFFYMPPSAQGERRQGTS